MPFSVIQGQDKPVSQLKKLLAHGCISGSYLFVGPEGVGKYLVSRCFAKALNCQRFVGDFCDECSSCAKIEKNQHPDVHFIDTGEDEIKIDHIRALRRDINLRPFEARNKVFILRNADKLNAESSSALLKTLEEHPRDAVIILVTAKPKMLFKTIISRCQIVRFSSVPVRQLEELLKKKHGLQESEAHFLAFFSEGKPGLALELKERQFYSFKNLVINEFGLTQKKTSLSLGQEIDKVSLRDVLNILASWFKDLYLLKNGIAARSLINLDRKTDLWMLKDALSFKELDMAMKFIFDSLGYLENNVNPKLLLANLGCLLNV